MSYSIILNAIYYHLRESCSGYFMNSQPRCNTCLIWSKLFHKTSAFFSSFRVLEKMSTQVRSSFRMLKCCEKSLTWMSILSLFNEDSTGFASTSWLQTTQFLGLTLGNLEFLSEVAGFTISTDFSSWVSSLCFLVLQEWRNGNGASKPYRWQAVMKWLTLRSQVFLPLVHVQRYNFTS